MNSPLSNYDLLNILFFPFKMNTERQKIITKMSHHLLEEQKRDITNIFNSIFNKPLNQS